MDKLIEKLMEQDFEDQFKPASEEELDKRLYYDEDELEEYLMNMPPEELLNMYSSFVGSPYTLVKEVLEQLSDEIKYRIYKDYVLGHRGGDTNIITAKEMEDIAKEEFRKKNPKS